jgi:uncharacterized protein Yka (UPF0111/DUF47 family)
MKIVRLFRRIFGHIEVMKYKNIAKAIEAATDVSMAVSDSVRKIILRCVE